MTEESTMTHVEHVLLTRAEETEIEVMVGGDAKSAKELKEVMLKKKRADYAVKHFDAQAKAEHEANNPKTTDHTPAPLPMAGSKTDRLNHIEASLQKTLSDLEKAK